MASADVAGDADAGAPLRWAEQISIAVPHRPAGCRLWSLISSLDSSCATRGFVMQSSLSLCRQSLVSVASTGHEGVVDTARI